MSLYKDASLVMIPSAYKDGKLYSIRPTDGSGDFTFSRGSNLAATRVDVNGLIEKGRENILTYSNDFTQSDWAKTGIASATGGEVGYDGSNDAYLITSNTSTINHYLRQSASTQSGVQTYSVYAKGNGYDMQLRATGVGGTTNWVSFNLVSGSVGTSGAGIIESKMTSIGNGWYRCSAAFNDSGSPFIGIYMVEDADTAGSGPSYTGDGTSGVFLQDAQAEAGLVATDYIETGASTAQAGILEDMPRLDYSGSCPALLLEPQRTNSITQSEYFGSSFWTKSGDVTLTSNYGISPEGYQNADRIVANATAGGHIVYRNISTTGTHTISVFAKASGYNHIFFGYDGGNLNFGIVFNLSNGTISQNPAGLTGDIEAIGSDGWYRCNLTFNYSTTNYYFVVSPHDNSSAYSWTGNGTDGILIYGAQIEYNSSYATSYIPTYGSAVTRSYDYLPNKSGMQNFLGTDTGTWFFHINDMFFDITGTGVGSFILTYTGTQLIEVIQDGNDQYKITLNNSAAVENLDGEDKVAISWSSAGLVIYVNGSSVYTTTSTAYSNAYASITINKETRPARVDLKQMMLFPTRLSNEELAALTTL